MLDPENGSITPRSSRSMLWRCTTDFKNLASQVARVNWPLKLGLSPARFSAKASGRGSSFIGGAILSTANYERLGFRLSHKALRFQFSCEVISYGWMPSY